MGRKIVCRRDEYQDERKSSDYFRLYRIYCSVFLLMTVLLLNVGIGLAQRGQSVKPPVHIQANDFYSGSFALVIGVSDYYLQG